MAYKFGTMGLMGEVSRTPDPRHEVRYADRVNAGDVVRLPDGRTGTVKAVEHLARRTGESIVAFGTFTIHCAKVVSVMPMQPRTWFFGLFMERPSRFADGEIDQLELVASGQEIDAVGPDDTLSAMIADLAK